MYYTIIEKTGGVLYGGNYVKSLCNDYEKLSDEYTKLLEKMKLYKNEHILLKQEIRLNRKLEQELEEKMLK